MSDQFKHDNLRLPFVTDISGVQLRKAFMNLAISDVSSTLPLARSSDYGTARTIREHCPGTGR